MNDNLSDCNIVNHILVTFLKVYSTSGMNKAQYDFMECGLTNDASHFKQFR